MKIRTNISKISFLWLIVVLTSCEKYLEIEPKDQVTDATIWSNTDNAGLFLNNIYSDLPRVYNDTDPIDNYSDDAMNDLNYTYSRTTYAQSIYTPVNGPSQWGEYSKIRKCNLFIKNVQSSVFSEGWKKQKLAEARFLRAYSYHLLWMYHGGVPIITDVLSQNSQGDEIYRKRNTKQETFKFIIDELTTSYIDLPLKSDAGRATRGAALTLKGWCELFEASPLNNPSNDQQKWILAANTNKQVIELGVYDLFNDYQTMFYEDNNNNIEEIFSRQYLANTPLGGSREGFTGPHKAGGENKSFGGVRPTHDLVQQYFMKNGLPITDPASGYDPQNPYKDREKRFYQSISYDGAEWLGNLMIYKVGSGSLLEFDPTDARAGANTGYDLVKGMNPKYAIHGDNKMNSASQKFFRYAEVLLSYAEAQNEASGPDPSVYAAINKVRVRSALPGLRSGLTQNEMRAAIRQERRVELAFEQKRLLDLLRWKIAEINLNRNLLGMRIDNVNGKWVYSVVPAVGGVRKFNANKNYLWPIPQSAMDKNSKLTQNDNY